MKRQPLWRSTPVAVFPVILGLVGLAHGWRGLGGVFGFSPAMGDVLLGVSVALLGFFTLSYLAKLLARRGVLMEDLRAPPGRAGLSALSMGYIVLAVGLLPYGEVARWVWWFGVVLHVVILMFVVKAIYKAPPAARVVTPFQYLPFVGLSTTPLAGVALGYPGLSQIFTYLSIAAFIVLTVRIGAKFMRTRPPAPLRPPFAIILAPLSLFGMAFGQFGPAFGPMLGFNIFFGLAWLAALVLLAAAGWITRSGFSPMWGALTFPAATFININIMAMGKGYGTLASTGAIAGALIGTPLIVYIVYHALKMWIKRDLAKKTGSAIA